MYRRYNITHFTLFFYDLFFFIIIDYIDINIFFIIITIDFICYIFFASSIFFFNY